MEDKISNRVPKQTKDRVSKQQPDVGLIIWLC